MKILCTDSALAIFMEINSGKAHAMLRAYQSIVSRPHDDPWEDREEAINRAREIFVLTGGEINISTAFKLYQDHLSTKERQIFIKEKKYGVQFYRRPACPDCDRPMQIWEVNTHPKNMVGGDFKTQWVCPDESGCGYQDEYSELTRWQWQKKISAEARKGKV